MVVRQVEVLQLRARRRRRRVAARQPVLDTTPIIRVPVRRYHRAYHQLERDGAAEPLRDLLGIRRRCVLHGRRWLLRGSIFRLRVRRNRSNDPSRVVGRNSTSVCAPSSCVRTTSYVVSGEKWGMNIWLRQRAPRRARPAVRATVEIASPAAARVRIAAEESAAETRCAKCGDRVAPALGLCLCRSQYV